MESISIPATVRHGNKFPGRCGRSPPTSAQEPVATYYRCGLLDGEAYEYRPLTWIGCVQLFKPDKERTLQRFGRDARNRNFLFSEEEKKTVRYAPYILYDVSNLGSFRCCSHVCFHVSAVSPALTLRRRTTSGVSHLLERFYSGHGLATSRYCIVPGDRDFDMRKGTIITGLDKQDR